jgi:hypothetical protein
LDEFATGPVFADIDGDLYPDLLVPSSKDGHLAVFRNDAGEGFDEMTKEAGFGAEFAPARAALAADIDTDGDLDVLVLRQGLAASTARARGVLWINDGAGHFENAEAGFEADRALQTATAALFIDANHDQRNDVWLSGEQGGALWLNQTAAGGSPRFERATIDEQAGGAFSVGAGDLDNDTDIDLLLIGAGSVQPAMAADAGAAELTNTDAGADAGTGDAGTSNSSTAENDSGAHTASAELGVPSLTGGGPAVLLNNDENVFTAGSKGTLALNYLGAASCIADFNNDGMQDLFQATAPAEFAAGGSPQSDAGRRYFDAALHLQLPSQPGHFVDAASAVGLEDAGEGQAVLCFDYDNDGDIDIAIAPFEGPVRFYQNQLDPEFGPANYVGVRLVGSEEHPNVLGAVVTVVTSALVQTRIVGQASISSSQGPEALHFGLSGYETVDRIRVTWPDGAEDTVVEGLGVNARHTFTRQ